MTDGEAEQGIFEAALRCPSAGERSRYLEQACGDDIGLRRRLEDLLAAVEGGGILDGVAPGLAVVADSRMRQDRIATAEGPGDRIGHYRLLEPLGEGGFGTVWMAEQEAPVSRRVALKVIKAGMDTQSVIARFEAERQALAMMDHPNIAKVHEAGTTDAGRPYFVMELVRGVKITDFCDANTLSTSDRLTLFIQVCHAVRHAHQKGVIHRDIKPSNVLVTVHDAVAMPKVIDFGIAKATTGTLTPHTLATGLAQFIGTPTYMSPEQAQPSGLDIDTRADIYSLGVLLYELLTGHQPFNLGQWPSSGLEEVRRAIREQDPPKPSTRLSTLDRLNLTAVASARRTEAPRLVHQVRGDLDWVVMKCLEKDRNRRYDTASELAADLQRHLDGQPVLACPPSAAYRLGKFARRHRVAVSAGLALSLAVLLALAGLMISNRLIAREKEEKSAALTRALAEKTRADENLSRARVAVKDFLIRTSQDSLLQSGDFQELRKDLLKSAVQYYEEFVRQDQQEPRLELERGLAYNDIGFLRQGLGETEQAEQDFTAAMKTIAGLTQRFPDDRLYPIRLAESKNNRAGALFQLGRTEEAEHEYRESLALLAACRSDPALPDHLEAEARIQGNLALLLKASGRLDEAGALLTVSVEAREALLKQGPDSLSLRGQLAHALNSLGTLRRANLQDRQAEESFERALEILDEPTVERLADGAPVPVEAEQNQAHAWNNLGTMWTDAGRLQDAERAFRSALSIKERLHRRFPSLPTYQYDLAGTHANLGAVLSSTGRSDEARRLYESAIDINERLTRDASNDPRFAVALAGNYSNLARLIVDEGQGEEALAWLEKSIQLLERVLERDKRVATARGSLSIACWTRAITLVGLGRFQEARADWDRALEYDDGRHGMAIRLERARNFLELGDLEAATADAEAVVASMEASPEALYKAARIHALAARRTADDPSAAEAYGGRAVVLLGRALAAGYHDFDHLKSDAHLESLRSREDFKRLMARP